MPTYDKDGHLFGDAVFRVKYWELQNENEEMQIRYSEENGLEIAVGTPTENNDIATKGYVDTAISTAIGDAIGGSY